MRRNLILGSILSLQAAAVAGLVVVLRHGTIPLGVRGEWEWLRVGSRPEAVHLTIAGMGVAAYSVFAAGVFGWLSRRATRGREWAAVVSLLFAAVLVQCVAHFGAPAGYGLEKWVIALHHRGSSGYFSVAKAEVRDPPRFLKEYPEWVRKQDALHLGTHPPALVFFEALLLHFMESNPRAARLVTDLAPESVSTMFRVYGQDRPLPVADRATLILTGALTLLACATSVVPLYWLARASLPARRAWSVAVLWPLVPSAILFQPTADTAMAFPATLALALTAHAVRASKPRAVWLGASAGLIFGAGMQFTLAFLAVGLVAGLITAFDRGSSVVSKTALLSSLGVAFLGFTLLFWAVSGANPFVIWWWNQANHARFYQEFPRTYRAWVVVNPIELVVGIGLPVATWALIGLRRPAGLPKVAVATLAVLCFLTLGGRNLSEVGRLWVPFMPALAVAAGSGMECAGSGPKSLGATVFLVGVQTLALEAIIQVVYPI